ncbi:MAG: GEVED domain-containing protein, partial [Candidatus Promineifilaceae bacterium]|nr:GEVED domain-containing protein [Candidatus Promineifilaceae bacterium]
LMFVLAAGAAADSNEIDRAPNAPTLTTPPTVNGWFYGDGDNLKYVEYATSDYGSVLYTFLDAPSNRLYVAAVISHDINDTVCAEQEMGNPATTNLYTQSAGWENHRDCDRASDSEYMSFTFTCGAINYSWQQGYACSTDAGPPENNWVSAESCGSSGGTTWPTGIVASSSWVGNVNTYQATYPLPHVNPVPWEMYTPGTGIADWKSPFLTSDPDDVTIVPGYDTFTTYEQLLAGEPANLGWEWSMVYEWSIDISGCGSNSITFSPDTAHHSPEKSPDFTQDETWPPVTDPIMDLGDLPEGIGLSYNTSVSNDGARHIIVPSAPFLGVELDAEPDGQPIATAQGDDPSGADDEDGLTSLALAAGQITVEVSNLAAGQSALLGIWFDWNNDGDFLDADEFQQFTVNPGTNILSIAIPADYITAGYPPLYLRMRLFSSAGAAPGGSLDVGDNIGLATDGEVEDYYLETPLAIALQDFTVNAGSELSLAILAAGLLLALVSIYIFLYRRVNHTN